MFGAVMHQERKPAAREFREGERKNKYTDHSNTTAQLSMP